MPHEGRTRRHGIPAPTAAEAKPTTAPPTSAGTPAPGATTASPAPASGAAGQPGTTPSEASGTSTAASRQAQPTTTQHPSDPKETAKDTAGAPDPAATSGGETSTEPKDGRSDGAAKAAPSDQPKDWRTLLDGVDPKELRSHPKLAGIAGEMAAKQAAKLAEEAISKRLAELDAERKQAEEDRLLDEDPLGYAERVKQQREEEKRLKTDRAELEQRQKAVYDRVHTRVRDVFQTLPDPVQQELLAKDYSAAATYEEGFGQFLKDVVAAAGKHDAEQRLTEREATRSKEWETRLAEARKEWERTEREALKKELLTDAALAEPTPNTDGGSAAGNAGPVTQEEADSHKGDRSWLRENRRNGRIAAGLKAKTLRSL